MLNHCILQRYRDSKDHITEHSDKTLDIAAGSLIVNYSAGASRAITFRAKERRGVVMENDSVLALDLETNRYYVQSVKKDCMAEGPRTSLTFRHVATFYDSKDLKAYGQLHRRKARVV